MGRAVCESLGDFVVIFPKQAMNSLSSSSSVGDYTALKKQIAELKDLIEELTIAMEDVDGKIEKAKTEVTNKIMGVGNPKYSTITDLSAQIDIIKNSVLSQKDELDSLKSLVGDASSGLTKKINDTKAELDDLSNNVAYIRVS